jgi:hypothetical protein
MKNLKLFLIVSIFLISIISVMAFDTVYNPFTGKLDYVNYANETFNNLSDKVSYNNALYNINLGNKNITADWGFLKLNWSYLQNVPLFSTYNATYDKYAYNQTISAINYANSNFYNKSANISWTVLDNFPIACPAGTFITQLGSSIICTASNTTSNSSVYWNGMTAINATQIENNGGTLNILESWINGAWCKLTGCSMIGNIDMGKNNVTNVRYTNYANATSTSAWRSYVNGSNSFIIEVSNG